jgi:hypothetical protein
MAQTKPSIASYADRKLEVDIRSPHQTPDFPEIGWLVSNQHVSVGLDPREATRCALMRLQKSRALWVGRWSG